MPFDPLGNFSGNSSCTPCDDKEFEKFEGDVSRIKICLKKPAKLELNLTNILYDREYFIVRNACPREPDVRAFYGVSPYPQADLSKTFSQLNGRRSVNIKYTGEVFGSSYVDEHGDQIIKDVMPYGTSYLKVFCTKLEVVQSQTDLITLNYYTPLLKNDLILLFFFKQNLDKQSVVNLLCMVDQIFQVPDRDVVLFFNGTNEYCRPLNESEKEVILNEPYLIRVKRGKLPNHEEAIVKGFVNKVMEFKILLGDYSKWYDFKYLDEINVIRAYLDEPLLNSLYLAIYAEEPKIIYKNNDKIEIQLNITVNLPAYVLVAVDIDNKINELLVNTYEKLENFSRSTFYCNKLFVDSNEPTAILISDIDGLEDKVFNIYLAGKSGINGLTNQIQSFRIRYKVNLEMWEPEEHSTHRRDNIKEEITKGALNSRNNAYVHIAFSLLLAIVIFMNF